MFIVFVPSANMSILTIVAVNSDTYIKLSSDSKSSDPGDNYITVTSQVSLPFSALASSLTAAALQIVHSNATVILANSVGSNSGIPSAIPAIVYL